MYLCKLIRWISKVLKFLNEVNESQRTFLEQFIHQITSITISSSNTIKQTLHDYRIKKYDLLIKNLLLTSEFKTFENTLSKLLHLSKTHFAGPKVSTTVAFPCCM